MSGEIERHGDRAPDTALPPQASDGDGRTGRFNTGFHATRKAGELDPEWVMAGVDVPAGKRLYASRDLKGSAFAVAAAEHSYTADGPSPGWAYELRRNSSCAARSCSTSASHSASVCHHSTRCATRMPIALTRSSSLRR